MIKDKLVYEIKKKKKRNCKILRLRIIVYPVNLKLDLTS